MLRYRALLVDTEKSYQRPVQQFFNDIEQATDWAKAVLKTAGEHASVVIYRSQETELHSLTRKDFQDDQVAVQSVQQASKETGQ